jgi:molybdopterin synthase catalytic subunit
MRTALVRRAIDATAVLREAASTSNGAGILFVGTVRETSDGRPVTGITYRAYEPMAERVLQAIADEAGGRFGTTDIVIEHRLGRLALGEISVAIAVAHPHRAEAYDASRYIIEQLKRRVPIWKLEEYVDGTREWVDPTRDAGRVRHAPQREGATSWSSADPVTAPSSSHPASLIPHPAEIDS